MTSRPLQARDASAVLPAPHRENGSTELQQIIRAALLIVLAMLVIAGTMHAATGRAEAATASCYGPGLFGNSMANGDTLHPHSIALAHRSLPFGTRMMVIVPGGKARMMVVRDRGPFHAGRQLDISQAGVARLGFASCRAFGVRWVRTWRYPYQGGRS